MKKKYIVFAVFLISFGIQAQLMVGGRLAGSTDSNLQSITDTDCSFVSSFQTLYGAAGIATDGSFLYSVVSSLNVVQKYDFNGQLLGEITSPPSFSSYLGGDLDFDGTNFWKVTEQDAMLYKFNVNGDILASYPLPTSTPQDPNNFGCAYDNGYIWSTEYEDRTLIKIDANTGQVVQAFNTNRRVLPLKIINGALYGIDFTLQTNNQLTLIKFDKTTGAVIEEIPWCFSYSLGFTWANNHLWGINSSNSTLYEFGNLLGNEQFYSDAKFTILPNPANEKITINGIDKIDKVAIYTISGQCVYDNPYLESIDVTRFSKGIYVVKVYSERRNSIQELIIN